MNLGFIKEFIRSPRKIGAIAPSSRYLSKKMVNEIDFNSSKCIVEYGAGTGVFTKNIVLQKPENTLFLVFEENKDFADNLKENFKLKNSVVIINDGCENLDKYLNYYKINKVDYIISGLPFTSLPENLSKKILNNTRMKLKDDGFFITFQYSLIKGKIFEQYFNKITINRVLPNLPPAFVLKCSNFK